MDDIYSDNYWQKQVNNLLKEKMTYLRTTEKSHDELRKYQDENDQLQQIVKTQ